MLQCRLATQSGRKTHYEAIYAGTIAGLSKHDLVAADVPVTALSVLLPGQVILAPSLEVAIGAASAMKALHNGVVLAFVSGTQRAKQLKFAAQQHLPLIIVEKDAARDNSSLNLPTITVEANDVVAIFRVTQEAFYRARIGGGPTRIACHKLNGMDPLAYMQHYLECKQLWSDSWKAKALGRQTER